MVISMTGFATKNVSVVLSDGSKATLTISIKTLNSRFFETTCKIPFALSHLENDFIKILKKRLLRGHAYLTIQTSNQAIFKGAVSPSLNTVENYLKAIKTIQERFDIKEPVSINTLLQLPNVLLVDDQVVDETAQKLVGDALEELCTTITKVRAEEGKALADDILERIRLMKAAIIIIEEASHILVEEQKAKVNEAVKELETDESQLAETRKNALCAILDKMDINEEIVRFKSHIASLEQQLAAATPEKGKRLDFTLQELGREINTIAAKCSDARIGAQAINVKVEIEKVREQVQNLV